MQQLVYEERREPFANSEIFRMLSQTNGMMSPSDSQNQKSRIAMRNTSSSCGKGEWRTYLALSADHLLMIRPTVTFWHSLRTSGNTNDEPLAEIASWHVMLFCLYRS